MSTAAVASSLNTATVETATKAPVRAPRIEFDANKFSPVRVMPVRHNLQDHPLLQLHALVGLAQRLGDKGSVRFHDDQATFKTSFVDAPRTNPLSAKPEEIVRSIQSAHAWLSLLNVQQDPEYRKLVGDVLETVRPIVDREDEGMCFRAGWIFVASPGAVTPYHIDHENNFILQISGKKQTYVWESLDRDVTSELALERFHGAGSRDLITFRDEIVSRAHNFELEPGHGAYMPANAPHSVKNGDNVSITISFTYFTPAVMKRKTLYRGNYFARRYGVSPAPVATSGQGLKHSFYRTIFGFQRLAKKLRGKPVRDWSLYYADGNSPAS